MKYNLKQFLSEVFECNLLFSIPHFLPEFVIW